MNSAQKVVEALLDEGMAEDTAMDRLGKAMDLVREAAHLLKSDTLVAEIEGAITTALGARRNRASDGVSWAQKLRKRQPAAQPSRSAAPAMA